MNIDRRVRAKEFIAYFQLKKMRFIAELTVGEIPQPLRINKKDVFWYESVVKKEVEKFKYKSE